MGLSAFNRARAIAAQLAQEGATPSDKSATVADLDKNETVSLLNLLNSAKSASELESLPTIGRGAAKRILANRPEGGYESVEGAIALNHEVCQAPYTVDWEKVQASVEG